MAEMQGTVYGPFSSEFQEDLLRDICVKDRGSSDWPVRKPTSSEGLRANRNAPSLQWSISETTESSMMTFLEFRILTEIG